MNHNKGIGPVQLHRPEEFATSPDLRLPPPPWGNNFVALNIGYFPGHDEPHEFSPECYYRSCRWCGWREK